MSSLIPAGYEYTVHNLSNAFVELGHKVTVFVLNPIHKGQKSILDMETIKYDVHKYWLPRTRGFFHPEIIQLYWYIMRLTKKFDFIHAHMVYPTGYNIIKALIKTPLPIIVTAHGIDIQIEPKIGYGLRLNKNVDKKVKYVLRNADRLTTVSNAMKKEMVAAGAEEDNITVISNPINLQEFIKVKPYKSRKPYIFAMGRLVHKKGFDLLIKTFQKIIGRINKNIMLFIAGTGIEEIKLRMFVSSLNMGERIRFLGSVYGKKKISLLKGCEFFVCPSRREPLGIVNLEAFAAGKPVVAFGVDGIPDIVHHGKTGLLAKPENIEDIAQKIETLLKNTQLRKRLSSNAANYAKSFNRINIAKKYESLYMGVIS